VRDEIVGKMNNQLKVKLIVGNVLTVCSLKWATVDKIVKDDLDNEYKVTEVNYNDFTITVTPLGSYVFTGKTLFLNTPYFFTGTPLATNSEWLTFSNDVGNKTPFIWLVEPTSENVYDDEDTGYQRDSNLRVVFLDTNNINQWLTMDTHDNRLQSLYYMRDEFIKVIKSSPLFKGVSNSSVRNITKFGTESSRGFETNIIDSNLTGLDCRLTLSIYEQADCKC
jgi:hypothetical protein